MNPILAKDVSRICKDFIFQNEIKNSTILVTGASGLIGSILLLSLNEINSLYGLGLRLLGNCRNRAKASKLFDESLLENFTFCDVQELSFEERIHFVFHCAAPTSSRFYVENPVDTISAIVNGTYNILNESVRVNSKGVVVLSSLESYGTILNDSTDLKETESGLIDPMDLRSSYSLGKKMSECICKSFNSQFNLSVKVARLTQVFGPGISHHDNRVFAQFSRSILKKEDLVLHTSGRSSKPYCYTTDAISALFFLMFKGSNGEVYNVANTETYISIKEMAELLCELFPSSNVVEELKSNHYYAPTTKLKLNTEKINSLGWKADTDIKEMFINLIEYLKFQEEYES